MTQKSYPAIAKALKTASVTLLGGTSQTMAADWQIDSAVLFYQEDGGDRVSVIEPVIKGETELSDDEVLRLRLVADTLTGATPNGAVPTDNVQTFTSPSGDTTYNTEAGEQPLDDTFRDVRAAIDVEWELGNAQHQTHTLGGFLSGEYDYRAAGISYSYSEEINQRATTLTGSVGLGYDQYEPIGGAPVGLSPMPAFGGDKATDSDGSKTLVDLLAGITQVIDRQTLMQFNIGIGLRDGYLNDPYKILSVVDSAGNLLSYSPSPTGFGDYSYHYEKRPDSRQTHTLYWKTVHQFEQDVVNVSYRYFGDDWGIKSHTIDLHYRWELNNQHFLKPHVRYYQQSAADFYRAFLRADQAVPQYASADYRLAELSTITLGLLYGFERSRNEYFNVRLELMQQETTEPEKFGALTKYQLGTDTEAIIFQLGYSFVF